MGLTPSSAYFLQHQVACPWLRRLSFSGSTEILPFRFFGLHYFEWASQVVLVIKNKQTKRKASCNVGDISESERESHSVMSDSLQPSGLYSPWNSPGQNTGAGGLSLLQGIFPIQGLNPGLLHCRQILYQLSHREAQEMQILSLG